LWNFGSPGDELAAQSFSMLQLVHLTRYGESRVEKQAHGSQNQENYLSDELSISTLVPSSES